MHAFTPNGGPSGARCKGPPQLQLSLGQPANSRGLPQVPCTPPSLANTHSKSSAAKAGATQEGHCAKGRMARVPCKDGWVKMTQARAARAHALAIHARRAGRVCAPIQARAGGLTSRPGGAGLSKLAGRYFAGKKRPAERSVNETTSVRVRQRHKHPTHPAGGPAL